MPARFARLLLLLTAFFFIPNRPARAEKIVSFESNVRAEKDASLDVDETIVYDFEGAQRHGIFRDIPTVYRRNAGTYSLRYEVQSVGNKSGGARPYALERNGDDLRIRIGDANTLVSGVQVYRIKMKFWRAVNWFDGAPEVYWNATGNQWPVPIESATARFFPPPGTDVSALKLKSFRGALGSTQEATAEIEDGAAVFAAQNLAPREGLTLVVGLPANAIEKPPATQALWWFVRDWWGAFAIPLLAAGAMFYQWQTKGRDVDGGLPAGVEWSPPQDLTPAEVGTLINESCDMTDILSTLIDLAARGYLVIEELPAQGGVLGLGAKKDYVFTRTRQDIPLDAPLKPHERTFLQGLFGDLAPSGRRVTLSSLENHFYMFLPQIQTSIYSGLTRNRLFASNPETTRNDYTGIGAILAVAGFFALFLVPFLGSISWGIGLIIAGAIVFASARAMPARTALGSRKLRECLGFQRFVKLAEKDRIEKLITDDPTIFGRLLPYAMVLGVGEVWATKFAGLMTQAPDWYVSPGYGPFLPHVFVSDLGYGMNSMGSTFASKPAPVQSDGAGGGSSGFGGGGFSGGGFGGGGGGSW